MIMQIFSNKIERDYDMILKFHDESKIFYSEEGRYKRKSWWWRKNMFEVFFCIRELRQQIMKYFDFNLENADLDHMVNFVFSDGAV